MSVVEQKETVEMSEDMAAASERAIRHLYQTITERDKLLDELKEAKAQIFEKDAQLAAMVSQHQIEMDAIRHTVEVMESRNQSHQIIRDQAVAERAAYETLFASFMAMMRTFKVPAAPLIKEVTEEQQGGTPNEV